MKNKKWAMYSVHKIEKDIRHHVIEWVAAFLSIFGAILNAQLKIEGFYIFILGNFMWVAFSIKHRHWGLLATNIVFFALNLYGVYVWITRGII